MIRFLLFSLFFSLITAQGFTQIIITGNTELCSGESSTLTATMTGSGYGTTNYIFEIINYSDHPPFSDGRPIDPDFTGCTSSGHDDCFAPANGPSLINGYPIGFTFCFFNQQYDRFWVGSNGWLGFTNPTGKGWTTYTATTIPNEASNVPKNCIFAPWQDWYPGAAGVAENVFYYNTGTAPNRKLVVYWADCPLFQCTDQNENRGTFMIVLNEQSSVIENFIQQKPQCTNSSEGATQGVHNLEGNIAYTATGRNYQVWTTANEGTRFNPSGVNWYKDAPPPAGVFVGYGDNLVVSPATTTTYYAIAGTCDGSNISANTTVNVYPRPPTPTIDGKANPCQNDIVTYTTGPGGSNYLWTYTGASLIIGGGSNDNWITLKWTASGTKLISVNYENSNGCEAITPGTLSVSVGAFEVPVINTPSPEACSGTVVPFTTQSGKSNYIWEYITSGAIWVSGGGLTDNSISLKWVTPGDKTIFVNYTDPNGCTGSPPTEKTVTIKPIPQLSPPLTKSICTGENTNFSLSSTPPGSMFSWTTPNPICTNIAPPCPTGNSNATMISDLLILNAYTAGSVNYFITPTLNNCTGPAQTVVINVNPIPGPADQILGSSYACTGWSHQMYSIPIIVNALGYSWTYSGTGATITNNGNTIFIDFAPNATSGDLRVKGLNGCGEGQSSPLFNITINPFPGPASTILGPTPVCSSWSNQIYSMPEVANATGYSWTYSGTGANITNNGNTVSIDFSPDATSGNLKGKGINSCADGTWSPDFFITVNPMPLVSLSQCNDQKTTKNAKPFLLKGGEPLGAGGIYRIDDPTAPAVPGNLFNPGDPAMTIGQHTIFYTYTNANACSATAQQTITIMGSNSGFSCGQLFYDIRDDEVYRTSLLSNCWMLENLRYGTKLNAPLQPQTDNCLVEKYCLSTDANCTAYGGLYQWDELIQYEATAGPGYQGVCPPGWHVPSQQEWQDMINAVANVTPGDGMAGGTLKDPYASFNALLNGVYYLNNLWAYTTGSPTATMFWTSTPSGISHAVARGLNNISYSVSYYPSFKANAFPVRCVKD